MTSARRALLRLRLEKPTPRSWFDGVTPCPECGHTCFDHCACLDPATGEMVDPPCLCAHAAHFEGAVE